MTNPAQPFQQNSPYSQEAEEAVLGAVLVNPHAFLNISAFLHPEDFFFLRHTHIWRALERLHGRSDPIDYLTVTQELRDLAVLDEIGGQAYLTYLINNTPSAVHAEVYGRLVERTSIRRKLLQTADEIRTLALNEEMNIESVISEAEASIFNVSDAQLKREFVPLWDAVSAYYDQMEYLLQNRGESLGLPTGFRALDGLLGGFQKSDLIVFAGRPGMGKTSFLLTVALSVARLGARVALFTMEMGVEQMVQRLISMETGISMQKLRLAQLTPRENARFTEAVGRLANLPIFIDDTPALTPIEMRTKSRRLQHEFGLDLVVVDYLQLMSGGKSGGETNRVQEISYISRSLKELARELNVTMLSAAQLSRAVEQRQDKRPLLSDLRESGCLAGESLVYLPDEARSVPIQELVGKSNFRVLSLNTDSWKLELGTVCNAFCTGVNPVYRLTTALGRTIRATANHKFLTIDGWKRLDELSDVDSLALPHMQVVKDMVSTTELGRDRIYPIPTATPTNENVYWDKILSIEADGETPVYDLTVDTYHNFCAEMMIVHNSIEQDADAVMFLYRDEVYNPETTEFPNQADVILAKHRNGPTGTISLYFEKTITKFMDVNMQRVDLSDLE